MSFIILKYLIITQIGLFSNIFSEKVDLLQQKSMLTPQKSGHLVQGKRKDLMPHPINNSTHHT